MNGKGLIIFFSFFCWNDKSQSAQLIWQHIWWLVQSIVIELLFFLLPTPTWTKDWLTDWVYWKSEWNQEYIRHKSNETPALYLALNTAISTLITFSSSSFSSSSSSSSSPTTVNTTAVTAISSTSSSSTSISSIASFGSEHQQQSVSGNSNFTISTAPTTAIANITLREAPVPERGPSGQYLNVPSSKRNEEEKSKRSSKASGGNNLSKYKCNRLCNSSCSFSSASSSSCSSDSSQRLYDDEYYLGKNLLPNSHHTHQVKGGPSQRKRFHRQFFPLPTPPPPQLRLNNTVPSGAEERHDNDVQEEDRRKSSTFTARAAFRQLLARLSISTRLASHCDPYISSSTLSYQRSSSLLLPVLDLHRGVSAVASSRHEPNTMSFLFRLVQYVFMISPKKQPNPKSLPKSASCSPSILLLRGHTQMLVVFSHTP